MRGGLYPQSKQVLFFFLSELRGNVFADRYAAQEGDVPEGFLRPTIFSSRIELGEERDQARGLK